MPLFAPDVLFRTIQPEGPIEKHGPDGVAEFMRAFLAEWSTYRVEIDEIDEVAPGRFLARGRQVGAGTTVQVETSSPAWVAVVAEGERITHLELWFEREPAEAALRED